MRDNPTNPEKKSKNKKNHTLLWGMAPWATVKHRAKWQGAKTGEYGDHRSKISKLWKNTGKGDRGVPGRH